MFIKDARYAKSFYKTVLCILLMLLEARESVLLDLSIVEINLQI